jgi:hypothetical protein
MVLRTLSTLLLLTFASACIVEAPGGDRRASGRKEAVVKEVPPVSLKLGANLQDKVEVVAVTLEPGRARPGDTVKVSAFFRVLDELDQDYMVFVHVEDPEGRLERTNVDHPPARGTYPTSQWKKGETVQDTFEVYVPPHATTRSLNLWAGFWHRETDTRLQLRNPDHVRNDGRNRILLANLPVGR